MSDPTQKLRLDKWLWQARFFKTRSLSAKQISGGHVRVNGTKVTKNSFGVTPGDVLTFVQAKRVRIVKVADLGVRRGPALEAQTLYEDMTPEQNPVPRAPGAGEKGRPTKRDRRNLDLMRASMLEE